MDYEIPTSIIPKDRVFVLGDNRNRSLDSHIWGCAHKGLILGKVLFKR